MVAKPVSKSVSQGLKPVMGSNSYGTTKVVP
jgi:hypothetical protein